MLCPDNIGIAVQDVKRNNGSAGVDGHMREDWARILARKYKPQPVRRVHQRIP
jgi:hypothetical protein